MGSFRALWVLRMHHAHIIRHLSEFGAARPERAAAFPWSRGGAVGRIRAQAFRQRRRQNAEQFDALRNGDVVEPERLEELRAARESLDRCARVRVSTGERERRMLTLSLPGMRNVLGGCYCHDSRELHL